MPNIEQYVKELSIGEWLGLSITLLSILLAVFFYRRSQRRKRPLYVTRSSLFLVPDPVIGTDVTILYKGSEVQRIAASEVVFWNAGNEVISSSDLAGKDLLRIVLPPDIQVLQAAIDKVSRDCIDFTLGPLPAPGRNEISLGFEFLDKNDGAAIRIVHTGTSDTKCQVAGAIKGVPEGARQMLRAEKDDFFRFRILGRRYEVDMVRPFVTVVPLVMIVVGALLIREQTVPGLWGTVLRAFVLLLLISTGLFWVVATRKVWTQRILPPKGLM